MPRGPARLALLLILALAAGCGEDAEPSPTRGPAAERPAPAAGPAALTVDQPLDGAVFPPGFVPPTLLWHDGAAGVEAWRIEVVFADGEAPIRVVSEGPPQPTGRTDERALGPTNEIYEGTSYQRSARSWTPDAATWSRIQQHSVDTPARLVIEGIGQDRAATPLSRGGVAIRTSKDPVGAPIFYRDVPLMPNRGEAGVIKPLAKEAIPLIAWRLRDVTRPESKVILTGMPSCANCHSFSLDGETLGMDVDGPQGDKGAYAIAKLDRLTVIGKDEVITWNSFEDKPAGHKTIGFLSRISPDGRFALTTLNESLYVSNFTNYKFLQVFYPTRGILAWTSKETGEMQALPGADDTDSVQCDPAWFPDGTQIVFARAPARDPYDPGRPLAAYAGDPNETEIRYDLYRMPFDGGQGGTPVRIEGASENGMSNTFPKVSPDGKWIVFTKCANGQLMRPDGRLWIVPAHGGEAREMRCNTSRMNSWHSFSPNGRWMVFSSKVNTPYTQMFLTHIDEEGNDTPAILIPNSTAANRAVNIPEFVNRRYADFDAIDVPAVEHHRRFQTGMEHVRQARYEDAVAAFEAALEEEPGFSRALVTLGFTLLELDRVAEARQRLEEAVRVAPLSSEAHNNLGLALGRQGAGERALALFRRAVELDFLNAPARHNLGLALFHSGAPRAALSALAEAARLDPGRADYRNDYGFLLGRAGRPTDAIREYRAAVRLDPDHIPAHKNLGFALLGLGDLTGALEQYEKALALDEQDAGVHRSLATVRMRRGDVVQALEHLEQAVALAPDDEDSLLGLAWHLATLPDDALRSGTKAVVLAEKARDASDSEEARTLDILAAAYAESGRFEEAVASARRALELARSKGGRVAPGLEARLAGYEEEHPHRQPARRAP